MQIPSILKKTLVSLTGLVLAGFVLVHMLGNVLFFVKDGQSGQRADVHNFDSRPRTVAVKRAGGKRW